MFRLIVEHTLRVKDLIIEALALSPWMPYESTRQKFDLHGQLHKAGSQIDILHAGCREVFVKPADLEKQFTSDGKVARP